MRLVGAATKVCFLSVCSRIPGTYQDYGTFFSTGNCNCQCVHFISTFSYISSCYEQLFLPPPSCCCVFSCVHLCELKRQINFTSKRYQTVAGCNCLWTIVYVACLERFFSCCCCFTPLHTPEESTRKGYIFVGTSAFTPGGEYQNVTAPLQSPKIRSIRVCTVLHEVVGLPVQIIATEHR